MVLNNSLIYVLIIGIILHFYVQFYKNCFNIDEIALGINITNRGFLELLFTPDEFQSALHFFDFLIFIFNYSVYNLLGKS
jgi:hypothetical protein